MKKVLYFLIFLSLNLSTCYPHYVDYSTDQFYISICQSHLHKKQYNIWINPKLSLDLYNKDNELVEQYNTVVDDLIIISDHEIQIQIYQSKNLKQLITITNEYVNRSTAD